MENVDDDLVSETDMLEDTRFHHRLKQCLPYSFKRFAGKRSATNIFLSFDMDIDRISLSFDSIAIQSHINSDPTFICVSSTINSSTFVFL